MRTTVTIATLALLGLAASIACARPDRDSLLQAWADYVASLPGTASLEPAGDGVYRLRDTDLPYDGDVRIVGALLRPAEVPGADSEFSYIGIVEFELADWPAERLGSQSYYYWLSDRQTLYYSESEARWVGPSVYSEMLAEQYSFRNNFGVLSFMLNYGIWVLLIALIAFVFMAASRQARKARSLMDETQAINQQARANIERAAGLQDELLAIARESRDLQAANNELLAKILDARPGTH